MTFVAPGGVVEESMFDELKNRNLRQIGKESSGNPMISSQQRADLSDSCLTQEQEDAQIENQWEWSSRPNFDAKSYFEGYSKGCGDSKEEQQQHPPLSKRRLCSSCDG